MNKAAKAGITGVCAAVFVLGGYGAYNVVHGLNGGSGSGGGKTFQPAAVSTDPPDDTKALATAQTFLDGWAAGPDGYTRSAAATDSPDAALTDEQQFAHWLGLTSMTVSQVTAGSATGITGAADVDFTATAHVTGGVWSWTGHVPVRQDSHGHTAVAWSLAVLYPKLTAGTKLAAGSLPTGAVTAKVVASDGKTPLSGFASLTDIAASIAKNATPKDNGSQGTGVVLVGADGTVQETLKVFSSAKAPVIRTTIDAKLQKAAEAAVLAPQVAGKSTGLVAIDHSNGWIKAVAFSGTEGDLALDGASAPGSTMKIVSAATLIDRAGMSPSTPATCLPSVQVMGKVFTNVDGESNQGASMQQAFEMSCNTAFIKLMDNAWGSTTPTSAFSQQSEEAHQVFGIGSWSIGGGVFTQDPKMDPVSDRVTMAANTIGQGTIEANPLVMASIAATVRGGGFHQPIILPGQKQQAAPQRIAPRTAADIQQMMIATAQHGTAQPRTADLPGVGAKTGTAEVDGQSATNGWFVAYDDHIAVAAETIGGGEGYTSAGWPVRDVLLADR